MEKAKTYNQLFDELAKVGYETMFEDRWENLPSESIERALWLSIAESMIRKLWGLYQEEAKHESRDMSSM